MGYGIGVGGSDSSLTPQLSRKIISENSAVEQKNRITFQVFNPTSNRRGKKTPNLCQTSGLNRPLSIY